MDRRLLWNVNPRRGDRVSEPQPEPEVGILMDPPAAPRTLQYWLYHGDPGLEFVDSRRAQAFEFDCKRITFPPVSEHWKGFNNPWEVKYFAFYRHSGSSLVRTGQVKRSLEGQNKSSETTWRAMTMAEDGQDCNERWDVVDNGGKTQGPVDQQMGVTWVPLVARERDAQALMAITNYYAPTNNKYTDLMSLGYTGHRQM